MPPIEVGGERPYRVTVEAGALGRASVPERRVALVVDAGLPERWVQRAQAAFQPELTIEVPAGDACKTLEVLGSVLSRLASANLPRDAAVVGLGGGATTRAHATKPSHAATPAPSTSRRIAYSATVPKS